MLYFSDKFSAVSPIPSVPYIFFIFGFRRFIDFSPKNSYLGVLRVFLWVLEVARIRRLGSVGEVSVWPGENRDLRLFLGKNVLEPILESNVVTKRR